MEALTPSTLPGVMHEACAYGWRITSSNKQPMDLSLEEAKARSISLGFSQQYCCHRAATYMSVAKDRPVQKKSKKVDCKCTLRVRSFYAYPEFYEFIIEKDRTNHVVGDFMDDIRTLSLPRDRLHEILQQLKHSSKTPRQIRIDMLKAADSYGRKSHRKVNYHDIWNTMNKIDKEMYHFDKDHMVSFKIWIETKLPSEGYECFTGKSVYTEDPSLFACGLVSPDQKIRMKNSSAFCLDAFHIIYMITNDHGTGPIVEWLQHLRDARLLVNPEQFTIDCCQAEAWNKHLASVSVPGFLPAQNRVLRIEMRSYLQRIVYEEDLDQSHQRIIGFQEEYADQTKFMVYFVKNWCTEDKFKVWSRSYKDIQFSHMLTNNFIESCHNQLKTVFLGRVRNKRLDKLVFVLVNDVEHYLLQEFERVIQGNGAMSPFFKQQRIRELEAEDREKMVGGPSDVDGEGIRRYHVSSFVDGASIDCSIEHMYLLKNHTNFSLHFPSCVDNYVVDNVTVLETAPMATVIQQDHNNELKDHFLDNVATLNHSRSDLTRLFKFMTKEEATVVDEILQRTMQITQRMKDNDEFLTKLDQTVCKRREVNERLLNDFSAFIGTPAVGSSENKEQQDYDMGGCDGGCSAVVGQSNTTTVNDKTQYRSNQKRSFLAWKCLMKVLPKAYLAFLVVQAKYDFQYCGGCKTLPVVLVEDGMFPLALTRPTAALHLSLCDFFVNLRNIFASSAEKIAEFYKVCANQTAQANLSADRCSNSIILYNNMVELSEQLVMGDISTSCAACPEFIYQVGSDNLNDKQYMMMDGNFRLKGRRSLLEDHDLSKVAGLDGFKTFWIHQALVDRYDPSAQPGAKGTTTTKGATATKATSTKGTSTTEKATFTKVAEPRKKQVVVHQNCTSAIYPVRRVFGSGCARHDTVFQLADPDAGEGFKYPLAALASVENQLGRKVYLHVIYDIICKLEPSIKVNFPGIAGSDRLCLSVLHAYAHVMHCQVKYNPRLIDNFGFTDGEGMERLWSYWAKYITMTKPIMAENRRYVLYMAIKYRNTAIKSKLGEDLRLVFEKTKEDNKIKKWSVEHFRGVEERYAKHVANLGEQRSSGTVVSHLLPKSYVDTHTFPLSLSAYISFKNILNGNANDYIRAAGRNVSERPTILGPLYFDFAESQWVEFLKVREALFKDILRSNVQAYFDLGDKLHSGHIEGMRNQKSQVIADICMYNTGNKELIESPYAVGHLGLCHGQGKRLLGGKLVRRRIDLAQMEILKEERKRESISKEREYLVSPLAKHAEGTGAWVLLQRAMKLNARWLTFTKHHLGYVGVFRSSLIASADVVSQEELEDEVNLVDEGQEDEKEESEEENNDA
ncbi:uncharacterized protein EV154DRAFT_571192 [Mucor mucedo]|uniref:uncharacterized protein n=1 Tax=Mucor mucedo TaxID=29922 RepID=UPI002220A671|nr:uncharacterized protein EV154DRAFT_571192 [Mucor mucedo]KAI7869413.1 hypothetical protein EV154DRAFT_571192 [Mucor mucedo]